MTTLTVVIKARHPDEMPPAEATLDRSLAFWLWHENAQEGLFAGGVYVSEEGLLKLLSARPLIEEMARAIDVRIHLDGDVPSVEPHPSLGKIAKILRGVKGLLLA